MRFSLPFRAFSLSFLAFSATVQLGAGPNIVKLVETGDSGPALDFIEVTPSDGSHIASRLGRAHITADNGYVVYVNGERIGAGGAALPNTDPAHSDHGWVKTDFYTFEASCEVPTAFALEGVDESGVASMLAEFEHCGTTTHTGDQWKCGAATAATQSQTRPTTTTENLLGCADGTTCLAAGSGGFGGQLAGQQSVSPDGWSCCNDHGGRAQCPPNMPIMCADATGCGDGQANCCAGGNSADADCSSQGGMADRQFIAVEQRLSWTDARRYCQTHYTDLASIHTAEEQKLASAECRQIVHTDALQIQSCSESSAYGDTEGSRGTSADNSHITCVDGTSCQVSGAGADPLGWGCCQYRGGRAQCPPNAPVMCVRQWGILAETANGANNFDCEVHEADCAQWGGTMDRRYGCENVFDNDATVRHCLCLVCLPLPLWAKTLPLPCGFPSGRLWRVVNGFGVRGMGPARIRQHGQRRLDGLPAEMG